MIAEQKLFNVVVETHNSLKHIDMNLTVKEIERQYYEIKREEVLFLLKLCEICQRKTVSRSKGPLKFILSSRVFERVQINLIDMLISFDDDSM